MANEYDNFVFTGGIVVHHPMVSEAPSDLKTVRIGERDRLEVFVAEDASWEELTQFLTPKHLYAVHLSSYIDAYADRGQQFVASNCENAAYCVLHHLAGSDWMTRAQIVEWVSGMTPPEGHLWLIDVGTEHYAVAFHGKILQSQVFQYTLQASEFEDHILCAWKQSAGDGFCVYEVLGKVEIAYSANCMTLLARYPQSPA